MQPPIPLASLLPATFDPATCKVHCAVFNGQNYPIDVLANDPAEWQRWNSWRPETNAFNRQFIFSLAQDRHDPTLWLFGGIWEVTGRRPEPRTYSYDVVPRDDLMGPFVRRLYVRLHLAGRQRRRTMESCLDEMTVSSLLEEAFVGDPFPGHDRINHTLADLQIIVSQQRPDWRIALEHMRASTSSTTRRPAPDTSGRPTATPAFGSAGARTPRHCTGTTSVSRSSWTRRARTTSAET